MSYSTFDLYLDSVESAMQSGKFEKAFEMWLKAARVPKKPAEAVSDLVASLTEIGEKAINADSENAAPLLRDCCEELVKLDPKGGNALYVGSVVARMYADIADDESALDWAEYTLAVISRTGRQGKTEEGLARLERGMALKNLERYEEALKESKQGEDLLQKRGHREPELAALTHAQIGGCLEELGDKQGALDRYRQELQLREDKNVGSPLELLMCFGRIGEILVELGELSDAIVVLEHGIQYFSTGSADDLAAALLNTRIANVWKMRGDLARALECLKFARQCYQDADFPEEVDEVNAMILEIEERREQVD
jgi:tetratricopeptide (TPR) repeat protein